MPRNLLVGATLAGLLLSGCTSKVTEQDQYSGFLPNYNNLEEVMTTSGEKAMRWESPSWNANAYDTVVFNKLESIRRPNPTSGSISRRWTNCRTT